MSAPGPRTIGLDPQTGGLSLPRLYFALLRQRFTGTLGLHQQDPAGERTVWFRGGMPVFCDWVSDHDQLGRMLIEAGHLDPGSLERALVAQRSGNGKFGDIVVDLQLIDTATRTEMLREQCVRRIVRTFAPGAIADQVVVSPGEHDRGQGDALAQINVLALLLRAISEAYGDARIQAELGPLLGGDLVATPALPRYERQFGFDHADGSVLAALARGTTMPRLMVPGVDPSRALIVVYTLWVAQMLRVGDDATQAIAKGATAAAAAHELGVSIGASSQAPGKPRPMPGKPTPKPAPAAKPTPAPSSPTPATAKPAPAPEPKPAPPPEPEPAAPEPANSAADEAFLSGLVALEAKLAEEIHAFGLFGLELDAGRSEVRAAWAELSRNYHPDALEGAGRAGLRERVERVFAALSEAYGILSDKAQRENLREALEATGGHLKAGEDAAVVVRNAFEAELLARDADKLLLAREYARAAEIFARAHELSPKDSDIEAALAYAEFRSGNGGGADRALARLTVVLDETPNCARAHYFKGLLELGLDQISAAKLSFASALKLDPRNIDAERQLRAIKLRERGPSGSQPEAKDDKKRGFGLRDLFKK